MARLELALPESYFFSTTIKVRVTDLNYGNHLANQALLGMAHEARVQWLASLGFTELNFAGAGLIMADSAIVYKSEGFYGDALLFELGVNDIHKLGFDLYYKVSNQSTGKLVAEIKTGILTFDYEARKLKALPEAARTKLVS